MSIISSSFPVMKAPEADLASVLPQYKETVSNLSHTFNFTEVEEDDLTMSGYVEDSFEFLDHMDCSVLDHMNCSLPYQVCPL